MPRGGDAPTRGEVSERVEKSREDMGEKEDEMEITTTDVETIRQTLESLEGGGTAEGAEQAETYVEHADDVTVEVFDGQNDELEEIQGENEDYEGELQERSGVAESDHEQLSEASAQIETDVAVSELENAKEAAREDVEFLEGETDKGREAREDSKQTQQEFKSRVSAKSGR